MPIRTIPEVGLQYSLVCVDGTGAERADDPDGVDGRLTTRVKEALEGRPYTDVFLMSHGWMGDVPAAVRQYDRWIGAMAACTDDLARARRVRPGFSPLLVGLHWPSLPFGDEELGGGSDISFATPGGQRRPASRHRGARRRLRRAHRGHAGRPRRARDHLRRRGG